MKLTKTHYLTIGIMIICAAVLIGWDLYVVSNKVQGDTISAILYETSLRLSFLPYAAGVIIGHLFWPRQEQSLIKDESLKGLFVCIFAGFLFIGFDVINLLYWKQDVLPLLGLVVGIVMGHVFWLNKGRKGE